MLGSAINGHKDFTSDPRPIDNGNSQGCPLLMILFSFYIAPLLDIACKEDGTSTIGFVDDTTLIARGKNFAETHEKLRNLLEKPLGALEWSRTHDAPFEISKLAVMNLTMSPTKARLATDLTFTLKETDGSTSQRTIAQVSTYKLLGVLIDDKLRWHRHHELVHTRAIQWTTLFSRLNRVTKGLPQALSRRLYLAVAIPRILYAVDIWYTPPHISNRGHRQLGSISITRKLTSVQRLAAIAITGALRTTAGDVAEAHANLFSIRTLLLHSALRATARLATLPKGHSLHRYLSFASRHFVQRHRTTLHHLFQIGKIQPSTMEKITPSRRHPNYSPPFDIRIDKRREEAKERDDEEREEGLRVYTDGSGYNGNIGAAAALYKDGELVKSLKFHLGTKEEHTVFEAELVGILLGLQLVKKVRNRRHKVIFNLDNQAAIQALTHQRPQPGQMILDAIHEAFIKLQGNEWDQISEDETVEEVTQAQSILSWIPGHEGAEGNKKADELAKDAAMGSTSDTPLLPPPLRSPLPISVSATKQRLLKYVKDKRAEEWKRSKRYERLKPIDPDFPLTGFQQLIRGISRDTTSLLIQLRTKHFPLNSYLHRIKRTDNPFCPHCGPGTYEDITHYLRLCPKYCEARHQIFSGPNYHILDRNALYCTKKGVELLTTFINATARFKTHYNIPKQREPHVE